MIRNHLAKKSNPMNHFGNNLNLLKIEFESAVSGPIPKMYVCVTIVLAT